MSKAIKLFLSRNRIRVLSFLFVATLLTGTLMVAGTMKVRLGASDVSHASALAVPSERRVQIVRFTLYDAGIYPQEARANPGRVTIALEDLTGSSPGLIVERVEEGSRARAGGVNKAPNRLRSRAELSLPAGRYELVDATRPDNRAFLIVED